MTTKINQVSNIIEALSQYSGSTYPTITNINHVDESLPKYYISPIQNYDDSNTEQIKYYNLLFKCSSESEKETVEATILALKSDNVVSGYNKTNNIDLTLTIDNYADNFKITYNTSTNVFSGKSLDDTSTKIGAYPEGSPYETSFYIFDLPNIIHDITLTDAKFWFMLTTTVTLEGGGVWYTTTRLFKEEIGDGFDLDNWTVGADADYGTFAYLMYPNNSNSTSPLTADTYYYLQEGSSTLYSYIQAWLNYKTTATKLFIWFNTMNATSGTQSSTPTAYARDSANSNPDKYSYLELEGTLDSSYPFYIDIKQVPVELEGRVMDYDPNNFYCQFQVEARWAI